MRIERAAITPMNLLVGLKEMWDCHPTVFLVKTVFVHFLLTLPLLSSGRSGRLAQLVEHLLDVQRVSGSSPLTSTK